jgi:hypothetical protein
MIYAISIHRINQKYRRANEGNFVKIKVSGWIKTTKRMTLITIKKIRDRDMKIK